MPLFLCSNRTSVLLADKTDKTKSVSAVISWADYKIAGCFHVRPFMPGKRCFCGQAACKPSAGLHVQGEGGHFYVTATAKPASKEISLEALEKRKMEINKYLVQGMGNRPHRLSLSQTPSIAGSQLDDSSMAPTPQNESPSPTPRTLSLSNPHNQEIPAMSEGSNPDLSHQRSSSSPRSGKLRGGLAFSDRPLLGGDADDLARSKSFTGQELRQWPSNLSVATGRDMDEESSQAMRRLAPPLHACLPS